MVLFILLGVYRVDASRCLEQTIRIVALVDMQEYIFLTRID